MGERITIAVVAGCIAFLFILWYCNARVIPEALAQDFTWGWRAAQSLLAHQNPYVTMQPSGAYPFDAPFKYPLTYGVLSLPFAWMSPHAATAAFGSVGVALLAFGLTRDGVHRLPLLASAPVIATAMVGQSTLLVASAALIPALAWLGGSLKPTTAILSVAYRPNTIRPAVIGGLILGALCLLFVPTWPLDWIHAMRSDPTNAQYYAAVRILPAGPLLLLAALRWRTSEGRLLIAAALVPQNHAFYSGVLPLLAARTYAESLVLALVSQVGFVGWNWYDHSANPAFHQAPWVLGFVYLPALMLTLRRPNVA